MHYLVAIQTFWLWDYRYAIKNVANEVVLFYFQVFFFLFLDLTFVFLQVMTFGGLLENCLVHRREYWIQSSSGRSV